MLLYDHPLRIWKNYVVVFIIWFHTFRFFQQPFHLYSSLRIHSGKQSWLSKCYFHFLYGIKVVQKWTGKCLYPNSNHYQIADRRYIKNQKSTIKIEIFSWYEQTIDRKISEIDNSAFNEKVIKIIYHREVYITIW